LLLANEAVGATSIHRRDRHWLDRLLLRTSEAIGGTSEPTPEAQSALLWALLANPQLQKILHGHDAGVLSVAFSPDGKRLASASEDKTVRLWDAESGEPLGRPLEGHENVVWSVVFSPDGKRLTSASFDQTVRLWDAKSGQPLGAPLTGHDGPVKSVAFSPDGKRLASASDDSTVRLWDAESGEPFGAPIEGHEGHVTSVAFSPDGKRLASAGGDGIRLWDVELQSWLKRACRIANRNLTREEWRKYLSDQTYHRTCRGPPRPRRRPASGGPPARAGPGQGAISEVGFGSD
jgi:WD40 repeat protein